MVTKVTDTIGRPLITFTIPGEEAEYVAIMRAVIVAMGCINEASESHIEARQTLSMLLLAMTPGENDLTIEKCKHSHKHSLNVSAR